MTCFEFSDPFFSLFKSAVELLQLIFQLSYYNPQPLNFSLILLKYSLFAGIIILFIHHFSELIEYLYDCCLNSLPGNSYIFFFFFFWQNQFLQIYFVPLPQLFSFASLCSLSLCVDICTFEKASTSLSSCTGFYSGKPSPISLPRDSESLSSLFCGCIFSGFVCEYS